MQLEYTILDQSSKKVKGTIEAASINEAKAILKEKKYLIVNIYEKRNMMTAASVVGFQKKGKLNFTQLVNFTRQMGIMINAGLSLVDALHIIASQTKNEQERLVVAKLEDYIKAGSPLSTAMKNYSESFPGYYISLVKAGESSGKLDDVFMRLAENLEKAREFRGKVSGALIYPMIIVIGIIAVGFIMMTFVMPKLLELYESFSVELPITTKFVIAISNFSSKYWPLILLAVAGGTIGGRIALRIPANKKILDGYALRIPVFGDIIRKSVLVEATRTLAILIKSGVPILEGMSIIRDTSTNELYREAFTNIYTSLEKGKTLGEALSENDLFPSIFVQMTTVGERTGTLDDTLLRLSRYFQMETEIAVKAATTLIEPLVLVVLGVGVGFLVLSVLTPIYNLTSSFGSGQ